MSGTLNINSQCRWMPAGWLYDAALERIGAELSLESSSLVELNRNARTTESGTLNLIDLSKEEFALFVTAVNKALVKAEAGGLSEFHDPSFFPGFLKHFRELAILLKSDPRATS